MKTEPVGDWATDYDIFDPAYVEAPYAVWDELRRRCPVAHSDRYGGSYMPTRYADVTAVAHDVEHFSSREVGVFQPPPEEIELNGDPIPGGLPPISSDPPVHTWARKLINPFFSLPSVARYEEFTRELCRSLVDKFLEDGGGDVAAGYAQQIPVRVIAGTLGVSPDMADTFTGWVRAILEFANDAEKRIPAVIALAEFFQEQIAYRKEHPGDDLISSLLAAEIDGEPVPDDHIMGTAALALIAGVDTTWSAIGASLWHLATHEEDRKRLVAEPELLPTAIEELLRAYSPVTMARAANEGAEVAGCPIPHDAKVLLSFPAANRDPEVFADADKVIIDRQQNRHVAFGVGIHRCAGSHLARMELRVAIEEFLARIPDFHLADGAEVTWAGGQVRGPRTCPVTIG